MVTLNNESTYLDENNISYQRRRRCLERMPKIKSSMESNEILETLNKIIYSLPQRNSLNYSTNGNYEDRSKENQKSEYFLPESKNWICKPSLKIVNSKASEGDKRRSYCDQKIIIDNEEYLLKDPLRIVTKNCNPLEDVKKKLMAKELQVFLNAQIEIKKLKQKDELAKRLNEDQSIKKENKLDFPKEFKANIRIIKDPFQKEIFKRGSKFRNLRMPKHSRKGEQNLQENNPKTKLYLNDSLEKLKNKIENFGSKLKTQIKSIKESNDKYNLLQVHKDQSNWTNKYKGKILKNRDNDQGYSDKTYHSNRMKLLNSENSIFIPIKSNENNPNRLLYFNVDDKNYFLQQLGNSENRSPSSLKNQYKNDYRDIFENNYPYSPYISKQFSRSRYFPTENLHQARIQ